MINTSVCTPAPSGVVDVSNDGLGSRMDVHMLYSHCLFAAAPELGKGFNLGRVGTQELDGHVAVALLLLEVLGSLGPAHQVHGESVGGCHLHG